MREQETMKLGELIGEYTAKKEAIIKRLNIISDDINSMRPVLPSDTKTFYAAILDIEGDAMSLLEEIKEFKRIHNKEVL
jgi:hypothetical protein